MSLGSKFQLQQTILIFKTISQTMLFPNEKKKNEHHLWISHVRISQGIEFYYLRPNLRKAGISG